MISALAPLLKSEKVDAILVTNKSNIRYFSNFTGTNGFLLLTAKRGFLFTDFRYHAVAKKVLPKDFALVDISAELKRPWQKILGSLHIKTLGFESGYVSHAKFLAMKKMSPKLRRSKLRWKDAGISLSEIRMMKTKDELFKIQTAQKITDEIFLRLLKKLKAGVSEKAIAWMIESYAHELGAEDISFPPIIGINEHAASPHHQNTDRKLKKGDIVLIDMGVIYKGYCSDMTRMIFTRPLRPVEQKIYTLVWEAQETAIKNLKAGVIGKTADAWARNHIKNAGFGKNFGHSLGHGVGLDVHELPNLSEKYEKPIPENSVVTVEPGIYIEGKFGVRLEDMVFVGKNGVENLTKSPKAIQDCTIALQ